MFVCLLLFRASPQEGRDLPEGAGLAWGGVGLS